MLPQSIVRTARTSCAHNANPLATAATRHVPSTPQIAAAAAGCLARQSTGRGHQRRPSSSSSSSASAPPNGQRPPASSSEDDPATIARDKENRKVRLLRRKLREANDAVHTKAADGGAAAKEHAFANVPAVPSTGHLQLADVKVSSFFALHRPMSVTSTFPPSSTDSSSFETIFQPPRHRPSDVIYTLSNAAAALESRAQSSSASSGSGDLNWQTLQQDGTTVAHLDPTSPQSIEQMIKNFRPFNPPPPPVAFDQRQKPAPSQRQVTHDRLDEYRQRQLNAVLEPTHSNPPSSSPSAHATSATLETPHRPRQRTPTASTAARQIHFGENGELGGERIEPSPPAALGLREKREMLLISVKRQRKLKMKKHKYKKLMRKTRNLRIREGRN